ncbi:hypothetical protein J4861_11965 [Prevotella melaninogenica]|nr:hypothetical protein [Prevotella melaninogenica]QUB62473.1 hypothetical protein J4861_11965 [Prevotella melaninogenica]
MKSKKAMRKKQEKKDYSAPCCMIIQVSETTYLMDTSFPSQHKKANHGTGPTASAKSFGLWSDEHFEEGSSEEANNDSSSSWDD